MKKWNYTPEHKSELQLVGLVLILIVLSFIGMMCSCGSTKTVHVPVEVERTVLRTDTLRLHTHSVDTVLERDSVFVWQRGDTVTREVTRWRYKVKLLSDTLWRTKTDSVFVEKPVTIEVEKSLGAWGKAKQKWGGWALGLLLVIAGVFIYKGYRRIYRR